MYIKKMLFFKIFLLKKNIKIGIVIVNDVKGLIMMFKIVKYILLFLVKFVVINIILLERLIKCKYKMFSFVR